MRKDKMIKTLEDWYPTHSDGTVRVSMFQLRTHEWRVCVWGDDDFGLEIDLDATQDWVAMLVDEGPPQQVLDIYNKIGDYTSQRELRDMGFQHC